MFKRRRRKKQPLSDSFVVGYSYQYKKKYVLCEKINFFEKKTDSFCKIYKNQILHFVCAAPYSLSLNIASLEFSFHNSVFALVLVTKTNLEKSKRVFLLEFLVSSSCFCANISTFMFTEHCRVIDII